MPWRKRGEWLVEGGVESGRGGGGGRRERTAFISSICQKKTACCKAFVKDVTQCVCVGTRGRGGIDGKEGGGGRCSVNLQVSELSVSRGDGLLPGLKVSMHLLDLCIAAAHFISQPCSLPCMHISDIRYGGMRGGGGGREGSLGELGMRAWH